MKLWPFDPLEPRAYDVVVVDVPSHFDLWSEKGNAKSPQAQYDTMTIAEIIALPVPDLLRPGGAVFYWCTWPTLARGDPIDIMRAWRLKASTGGSWIKRTAANKISIGPGIVWRSACEPIIVASKPTDGSKRGARLRGPKTRNLIETFESFAVDGLRREHSRKPDEFYDLVETLSPGARRVDLFSRQSRPGWDTWGREATKFDRR